MDPILLPIPGPPCSSLWVLGAPWGSTSGGGALSVPHIFVGVWGCCCRAVALGPPTSGGSCSLSLGGDRLGVRANGRCSSALSLRSSSSKLAQLTLEQILEHLDNLRLNLTNTKQNCTYRRATGTGPGGCSRSPSPSL